MEYMKPAKNVGTLPTTKCFLTGLEINFIFCQSYSLIDFKVSAMIKTYLQVELKKD